MQSVSSVDVFVASDLVDNFEVVMARNAYLTATAVGLVWMLVNFVMQLLRKNSKVPWMHLFSFPSVLFCFLHLFILDMSVAKQKSASEEWFSSAVAASRHFSFLLTAWEGIQLIAIIFASLTTLYYKRDVTIPSKVFLFLSFGTGVGASVLLLVDAKWSSPLPVCVNFSRSENESPSQCAVDWRKTSIWTDYTDLFYPTVALALLALSLLALLLYNEWSPSFHDKRDKIIVKAFQNLIFTCGLIAVAALLSVIPGLIALLRTNETLPVSDDPFNIFLWKLTAIAFPLPSITSMLLVLYHENERNDFFKATLREKAYRLARIVRNQIDVTRLLRFSSSGCTPGNQSENSASSSFDDVAGRSMRSTGVDVSSESGFLSDHSTNTNQITTSDRIISTDLKTKAIREEILGVGRTFVRRDKHQQLIQPNSGGDLRLKESEVRVIVPKGALAKETPITLSSYFPVESSNSSAVMSITEVLPHGLTLRKRSTIRIRHHICLDKPYRVRVFYQSGTNLREKYRLIADLRPGHSSTIDSEREIKITEDSIEISCYGFSRYCIVKEGFFFLSGRIYSPNRPTQSKRKSVCATVSCQCRDVTDEIDEEMRRQGMEFRSSFSASFNVETLEKISIRLVEDDGYTIEGTNCYYFEARMLQTLIGEDHYKKISRHFRLRLSNEAPVELPFELQEFDKENKDAGKIVDTVYVEMIYPQPLQAPQMSPVIDFRPSVSQINNLSYEIGYRWKDVAYRLKPVPFDCNDIACFEAERPGDLRGQAQSMLDAWIRKYSSEATVGVLCEVLIQAGLRNQAEKVFAKLIVDKY